MKKVITVFLFFMVCACEDNQERLKVLEGDIVGFVRLHDEYGDPLEDHSGAVMTLDENHKATSNASGKFEFAGVPAGTYEVTIEKEGFSTFKVFGFEFAGGTIKDFVLPVDLIRTPSKVLSYAARITPDGIETYGNAIPGERTSLILFVGSKDNVSNVYYEDPGIIINVGCCTSDGQFQFMTSVPKTLTSGPIYVALYERPSGASYGGFDYFNPQTQQYSFGAAKKVKETVRIR